MKLSLLDLYSYYPISSTSSATATILEKAIVGKNNYDKITNFPPKDSLVITFGDLLNPLYAG